MLFRSNAAGAGGFGQTDSSLIARAAKAKAVSRNMGREGRRGGQQQDTAHVTGEVPNPDNPEPDKIRTYLMKNKMTPRILRF